MKLKRASEDTVLAPELPEQRLCVSFTDGQEAVIPIDFAHTLQVLGPDGAIVATVALNGVSDVDVTL